MALPRGLAGLCPQQESDPDFTSLALEISGTNLD